MRKLICLLAACLLMAAMCMNVLAEETVQSMIEELPTVEQFQAMDADAQLEAYNKTQAAYDAYMALSQEDRAEFAGAEETFETLFAHFNSLVMPVEEVQEEEIKSPQERIGTIAMTVAAFVVGFGLVNVMKNRK
jgi:hypothetical protein